MEIEGENEKKGKKRDSEEERSWCCVGVEMPERVSTLLALSQQHRGWKKLMLQNSGRRTGRRPPRRFYSWEDSRNKKKMSVTGWYSPSRL